MKLLTKATMLFLVILFGCQKDYTVEPIDSDIEIYLWETLGTSNRTLHFNCATERIYGCYNYTISTKYKETSDNIKIDFNGVIIPEFCLTALGPAKSTVDLGSLSTGTYNLNIEVEGKKSKGKLIVSPESYAIEITNPKQIKIKNSPLYRIPGGTIWGTVGHHAASSAALAQSFIDSLQTIGAKAKTYQSGDYGYFKIDANGEIVTPEGHGYYYIKPFVFAFTGNNRDLIALVKSYGRDYGQLLNIYLYMASGEQLHSSIP